MKSGIYVLVISTSGSVLLVENETGGPSLPSYKHWPLTKKPPRNFWPVMLLKHITFGLFDQFTAERQKRPFGLPPENLFYIVRIEDSFLDQIIDTCRTIRLWHKHYANCIEPWTLRKVKLDDVIVDEHLDLHSAHCLRFHKEKAEGPNEVE